MPGGKHKKPRKPRLGRSPMPPPGHLMESDSYDRDAERREAEREIEEGRREREEKGSDQTDADASPGAWDRDDA